jgi:hypothetical protein
MREEVYKKLARHLDNLPGGFPPTGSGVELPNNRTCPRISSMLPSNWQKPVG